MSRIRIGGPSPPDGRNQFGRLLRRAFPIRLGSFKGLPGIFKDAKRPSKGT